MDVSNNWMDDVYLYSSDLSTHFNNADCAANFKRLPWREFYGMRNVQGLESFIRDRLTIGQTTTTRWAFNFKG